MPKKISEEQRVAINSIADLVGKGATEVYKMFVRNTIVEGLILVIIALGLIGGAVVLALGIVLPPASWGLLALALGAIVWAVSLLANPAYHALGDLLDRVQNGK